MSVVSAKNLSFRIDDEKIIKNFSHDFEAEKMTGILAPVEEHISCLIKLIAGIYQPTLGVVYINGVDIFGENEKKIQEVRKKIGFCFERGGLISNLTVLENLLLPFDFHFPDRSLEDKKTRIMQAFAQLDVHEDILTQRPARLHKQMYKLMLLIRAFILDPAIILYDDPFLDLELHYRKLVYKYMMYLRDEQKVTQIFVSSSDILFQVADQIVVFNHGTHIETGDWTGLLVNGKPTTHRLIKQYIESEVGSM